MTLPHEHFPRGPLNWCHLRSFVPWLIAGFAVVGFSQRVCAALPTHVEIQAAFDALDTDHNHGISHDEWRVASELLFTANDKNHDGFIERSELGTNEMMRETFPSVDEGHTGKLTKAEFLDLREIIFRAADIDRDDYISIVEYEVLVLLRRTGWKDRDHNGLIEMSELRAVLAQAFPLLDTNHDGVLTSNEAAFFAPAHREAMDPKGTGRITLLQMVNGYRFLLGADQVNRNIVPRSIPLPP